MQLGSGRAILVAMMRASMLFLWGIIVFFGTSSCLRTYLSVWSENIWLETPNKRRQCVGFRDYKLVYLLISVGIKGSLLFVSSAEATALCALDTLTNTLIDSEWYITSFCPDRNILWIHLSMKGVPGRRPSVTMPVTSDSMRKPKQSIC